MDEIVVIRDEPGLESLRAEWDALLEQSDATPFQTWEWQRAWWRHFGRGRLWLWTLRRHGRLVALAPLVIRRHRGLPLRELALGGTGASDRLGLLSRPEDSAFADTLLLAEIARRRGEWDLVDLQQLGERAALLESATPTGCRGGPERQEPCPFVVLPSSWEEFLATLGKKRRSNIRYYERLLGRTFEVEMESACPDTVDGMLDALFQLHRRRWRGRGLPGAFVGPRVRRFHREVAARFARRGWLRLHALRLDGQWRAVIYCFAMGKVTYYYQSGFDPEYARYSIGTVMIAHAIRHAIESGEREFDFLRGGERYKYGWGAADRYNWRFLLWQPSVRGSISAALIRVEEEIERRLKRWARGR